MDIESVTAIAEKQLKKAKMLMMMKLDTAFYTTILFSLKQSFTDAIPTLATNGRELLINPTFFIEHDQATQITFLAHETLHVALDHMHRLGDRDPQLWNIAADYVINDSLVLANYPMPSFACHDVRYREMTTEEVYKLLDEKNEQAKESLIDKFGGGNSGMGSDIQYPSSTGDGNGDGEEGVTKEDVAVIVMRAFTQAKALGKGVGNIPGEILITLDKVINPRLPWHTILQNYLTEYTKDDYSFRRANKRFLPQYYLPTAHSEGLGHIAIAVDSSGSVTDEEFNVFVGKIQEIKETVNPKKISVVAFDSVIKDTQVLEENDDPFKKLKFAGRGGTRIGPVLQWAADVKPTIMLVFTDGEFSQKVPIDKSIPIIWVIHNNPKWKTDYGRTIHFEI